MGHHGRQGTFAEYALVAQDRLYPLPTRVAAHEAVAVLHTGATAYLGLMRAVKLQPGEAALVEGGAGWVGSAVVVQLASAAGARVTATAAAEDKKWLYELGAPTVLDYHHPDLYLQIREVPPLGINIWWYTSGHARFAVVGSGS